MTRVFISYSTVDRPAADYVAQVLKDNQVDVFIDYQRLQAGQPFPDQLREEIVGCDCVVFIVSPRSVNSKWVAAEIDLAHDLNKKIIPLVLEKTDEFDVKFWPIRRIERIDFTDWNTTKGVEPATQKLLTAITNHKALGILPIGGSRPSRRRLWTITVILFISTFILFIVLRSNPPSKVSLAYSFLVDTSDAMNASLNGEPRIEIAKNAVDTIVNFAGFDVSDTWRVFRTAGGNSCDDSQPLVSGSTTEISPSEFMGRIKLQPRGINAYKTGINKSIDDLSVGPASTSDVKVAFILFASLDPKPCKGPNQKDQNIDTIIASLAVYKTRKIKTGLCLFGLAADLQGFRRIQESAAAQGIDTSCFYNFDSSDADDIGQIAIGEIQRQIGLATNEQRITPIVNVTPLNTVIPNTFTPKPSAPVITQVPLTATLTPTRSQTSTITPTLSATPTPTRTVSPTRTLTYTPTPTETINTAIIVKTLDAAATTEAAKTNQVATATESAAQTATAARWTATLTATLTPNLTASIEAFRTQQLATVTAQYIVGLTATASASTNTPTPTNTKVPNTNTALPPTATDTFVPPTVNIAETAAVQVIVATNQIATMIAAQSTQNPFSLSNADMLATQIAAQPTNTEVSPTNAPIVPTSTSTQAPLTAPPIGGGAGQIAFASNRSGNNQIYVMDADGQNLRRVTNDEASDFGPAWSPDGSKIVFFSTIESKNNQIYIIDADGTNLRRLTNSTATDKYPKWSPDGSKIAFESSKDGKAENFDIYVIDVNGNNLQQLTTASGADTCPDWSPDGKYIAFCSNRDGNYEIYVINADGSNERNLTTNHFDDMSPTWSPDGNQVAFFSNRFGKAQIYVMNADGTNQHNLSNNQASDGAQVWSSDGKYLVFQSDRDNNAEIYRMDNTGGNQVNLTQNKANDSVPAWRPAAPNPDPLLKLPLIPLKHSPLLNSAFENFATAVPETKFGIGQEVCILNQTGLSASAGGAAVVTLNKGEEAWIKSTATFNGYYMLQSDKHGTNGWVNGNDFAAKVGSCAN